LTARALIVLVVLVSFSLAFQTSVLLHDAQRIHVHSELDLPISFSRSFDVSEGHALITVEYADLDSRLDKVWSRLVGDVVEINIEGETALSTLESDSSAAGRIIRSWGLGSVVAFVLMGCFISHSRTPLIMFALVVLVVAVQSERLMDGHIHIQLPMNASIEELRVVSGGSVLVPHDMREICENGRDSLSMHTCHGLSCLLGDDDCLMPNSVRVGALLQTGDYADFVHLEAIHVMAENIGHRVELSQMIIAPASQGGSEMVASAQRLYDVGCRIFAGPQYSGDALAVLEWADNTDPQISFISPTASSTELANRPNFVSLFAENGHYGRIFCHYMSYMRNNAQTGITMSVVRSNAAYVQDLFQEMLEYCPRVHIHLEEAVVYDVDQTAEEAHELMSTLSQSLQGTDPQLHGVLHIGFAPELADLLEAIDDSTFEALYRQWFCTDSAFDETLTSRPAARSLASRLGLLSMHMVGYNYDQAANVRFETLSQVYLKSKELSMFCPFILDSVMLTYLTLEHIDANIADSQVFIDNAIEISRSIYGATGLLEIDSQGFRANNEYLSGFVSDPSTVMDVPWTSHLYFSYAPGRGEDEFTRSLTEKISVNPVMYYDFHSSNYSCPLQRLEISCFDHLSRPLTVSLREQDLSNLSLLLPKFNRIIINAYCEDKLGIVYCPGDPRSQGSECKKGSRALPFISKEAPSSKASSPNPFPVTGNSGSVFDEDTVIMRKSDNMFSAYDGAKGTTLGQLDPNIKPMDFSASFP